MQFFRKLTLALASVILVFGVGLAQDDDIASAVAVPAAVADETADAESPVLLNLKLNPNNDEKSEEPQKPPAPVFVEPRPIIRQIGSSTGQRPGFLETLRNLNVTGRLGNLRRRLGRFHVPRLETNEQSLPYRAGRRIGLIFQSLGKRARAFAERLRSRANTATPTV